MTKIRGYKETKSRNADWGKAESRGVKVKTYIKNGLARQ